MILNKEEFTKIVELALDKIPEKFKERINNLAVLVEDFPSPVQQRKLNIKSKYGLLGLYEGYVQSSRSNVGPVLPDRITIFRKPIIKSCSTKEECIKLIINTLKHEIAHHFGSDEKGARNAGRS